MRLRETFLFEAGYQARQRSTWAYAAVLLGLAFLAMTRFVANARGSVFTAPLAIAGATIVTGMLGLLVTAAVAGDVVTRAARTRMEPLLHAAPVTRRAYLGGRFLGAFGVNALLLTAVPAGILLAAAAQRLGPGGVGPFRPAAYLGAYFFLALPNAFVATALLFSLGMLARSAVPAYVGALVLFLGALLNEGVLAEAMGRWELARLLDPFGMVLLRELVRSWTPAQKDTLLIGLEGPLLWNRLLWLGIAVAALALTHLRFRFGHPAAAGRPGRAAAIRRRQVMAEAVPARSAPVVVPWTRRSSGLAIRARQTLAVAGEAFRATVMGRGVFLLVVPAALLLLTGPVWMREMGVPLFPTTAEVLGVLLDPGNLFLRVAAPFVVALCAGELVWRERDARMSDIADAAPVPDGVLLAGRLLGLALVLVAVQALTMAAGMLVQASTGYHHFEVGVYLRALFGLQLADYLLFAVLALAVHVAVDHRYVGHLVVLLAYAFTLFAPRLGIVRALLLVYGSDPGWAYSDMRGFGGAVRPWLWLKLYWAGWALLLGVAARLLWVRGREREPGRRLRLARRRFTRPVVGVAAAAMGLILALGGLVLHDTAVPNDHRSASDRTGRRAEYERRYGRYEGTPQPEVTGTRLHVELHPGRGAAEIRGAYRLVNRSGVPVDSVHLTTAADVETGEIGFDRPATRVLADDGLGYRIYALREPLRPGESLWLGFSVRSGPRGFPDRADDPSVAANGTYLVAREWLPAVGYQPGRTLNGAAARRSVAGTERIAFDAVVGTDAGETAVAPGTLRRTWTEGGRRYFHYAADAPIRNDYAFHSAAYAVREARWRGVEIQVFHHPGHAWNVDRMIRGVRASLESYGRRFGAYPYRQIRLVERPGRGNSLHSAPVDIAYEEGFALFHPEEDPRGVDFPFALVAHEVAHQWWGNRLAPAAVEGFPVLTESLAWYSAFGVVEEAYGPEQLRRLLAMLREAYLAPRARAGVPLLRATDPFLAYRRGPFAMYALREYVGAERVDAALRRLLEEHGSGAAPLPTSLDLYRELRAATPDSLRPLLHDLFAENTFWELETETARAEPAGAGAWRVTLEVRARKVVVDTAGVETEAPMDDPVEVGVFAAGKDGGPGAPLYLRVHRVRSGRQRITVTVRGEPARAGIDPRVLLVGARDGDRVREVRLRTPGGAPES